MFNRWSLPQHPEGALTPSYCKETRESALSTMTDDIRRRLACDRCHSQKLRCPRRPGKDTCDRCHKARTSCIFSPFRQKKPPQEDQGSTSVVATSQTPAVASQIDFLSEDVSNSNKRKRIDTHSENIGKFCF